MRRMSLPDANFCFTDDARARAVAEALDLAKLLVPAPDNDRGSVAVSVMTHPTHYLLIQKFHGHDKPEDNGFIAWGWAKNQVSQAEAALRMNHVIRHFLPDKITVKYL